LDRTVAMVNFDMVGRVRGNRVSVSGIESAAGLRAAVAPASAGSPLKLDLRDSPHGPSDHVRFYTAGVPVVFFNTGRHDDYHKPSDTADRVDTAGMERIGVVAVRLLRGVAAAPPAPSQQGAQPGSGAFLGVALDGHGESDGLRLGAIVPGTGAARAGLREGDVLVRIGDISINGFDDLRKALARQAPGGAPPAPVPRGG